MKWLIPGRLDLTNILSQYFAEAIFICDETGLFYKMEPSKYYVLKGETCTSGKRSNEQITVLPCTNKTGTEKLPPRLATGKSQSP